MGSWMTLPCGQHQLENNTPRTTRRPRLPATLADAHRSARPVRASARLSEPQRLVGGPPNVRAGRATTRGRPTDPTAVALPKLARPRARERTPIPRLR